MTPFLGNSTFANEVRNLIKVVSENNASVLLKGERGTGKRLFAQNVHFNVCGSFADFYEINCKSFDVSNCQKVLKKIQVSDLTARKTLYINYLESMPLNFQLELAAFIKNCWQQKINIRVICSSEVNISELVAQGSFSSDLFYLLNNIVLNFIPLRQRREDILPICQYYFEWLKRDSGTLFEKFSESAETLMTEYYWKGNADEIINAIQRAFIVGELPVIKAEDLGIGFPKTSDFTAVVSETDLSLKEAVDSFKKYYVTKVLQDNNWNQTQTAKILGIQRTYVIRLMNELQIRK